MIITKISQAVKTEGRYNVFVDEQYSFSLDESQLVKLNVRKGQELTEEELAKLKDESEFGKSYIRAVDLISRRPRSEKEIRDYAWKKQWSAEIRDRVIERLKERLYLNDEKFAESFVRSRTNTRNFSKRKMQAELMKKGIQKELMEKVLADSDFDESESLKNLMAKKRDKYDSTEKLVQYLARQGFRYDHIKSALDEMQ
ncbi:RecX family transcriptional regulator [Candidatus Saccharibacteria bacterium]|nr:RecX family transcriptional regulator [Candidatus Saccharibacteria bacterium]